MILDFPMIGLVKMEISNDNGVTWADQTDVLQSISIKRAVNVSGPSVTAAPGTCTLTIRDSRGDVWAEPLFHVNQMIRVRNVQNANQPLFTGSVDDVGGKADLDPNTGEPVLIVTVEASDDTQKHSNTTVKEAVSQVIDSIEPGAEWWHLRLRRLAAMATPGTKFDIPDRLTTRVYSLGEKTNG